MTRPVAHATVRRLLEGNGIGSVTFGQSRRVVRAELARLLGPAHETIPGICGFGRSTDWIGLNLNSPEANLSAELNLSFKGSLFVGYAYLTSTEGPARQRHGLLLATRKGLTLGNTVARARKLYGRAFNETEVPQGTPPSAKLPRLPVGEISTVSGEIAAGIQGIGRIDRATPQSTVVVIGAGVRTEHALLTRTIGSVIENTEVPGTAPSPETGDSVKGEGQLSRDANRAIGRRLSREPGLCHGAEALTAIDRAATHLHARLNGAAVTPAIRTPLEQTLTRDDSDNMTS